MMDKGGRAGRQTSVSHTAPQLGSAEEDDKARGTYTHVHTHTQTH